MRSSSNNLVIQPRLKLLKAANDLLCFKENETKVFSETAGWEGSGSRNYQEVREELRSQTEGRIGRNIGLVV